MKEQKKPKEDKVISYVDYDVNITRDYGFIKRYYNKLPISAKDKEVFLNEIEFFCKGFAENHNLNFKEYFTKEFPFLINDDFENFEQYIGFSLLWRDLQKIGPFLDYQLEKSKDRERFILIIENTTYDFVKRIAIYRKESLLREIQKWVNNIKNKNVNITAIDKVSLWKGTDTELKKLAQELKRKQFVKKASDFIAGFKEQKSILWQTDPEKCAYLIYKLGKVYGKINAKNKGYFKAIDGLFYDSKNEKVNNFSSNYLKDLSYSVITRYPKKHELTRKSIDFILKEVFNPS